MSDEKLWERLPMTKRVCGKPGCPNVTDRSLCPEHRPTRAERGYGNAHDKLRALYQARMDAGETFTCWRCPALIDPKRWHLGHDDHDRSIYRGPECVPCNTATAGRKR